MFYVFWLRVLFRGSFYPFFVLCVFSFVLLLCVLEFVLVFSVLFVFLGIPPLSLFCLFLFFLFFCVAVVFFVVVPCLLFFMFLFFFATVVTAPHFSYRSNVSVVRRERVPRWEGKETCGVELLWCNIIWGGAECFLL